MPTTSIHNDAPRDHDSAAMAAALHDELAAMAAMAADLASVYDLLILADPLAFGTLDAHGATLLARAQVVEVGTAAAIDDPQAHALIKAGKPVLTWCSATPNGRDVARRLHDAVPALKHIVTCAPETWVGTPPLDDLVSGAMKAKPPPIRRPADPHTARAVPIDHAALDTSPGALAGHIIRQCGSDLLVVDDGDFGTGYALDPTTGIWRSSGEPWARWLVEVAESMTATMIRVGLSGKALTAAVASAQRLKRSGNVDEIRRMLRAMLGYVRDNKGAPCADVTECRADQIDADTRYFGAANGVVDLHKGRLLPPVEGRKALVTMCTPVEFHPEATHPAVDKLFAHLDPEAIRWWWRVLGFGLLGAPSRRFYFAVGPPSGGKTTLANAICSVLGPYASRPADGALDARATGSAGLSPEMEAFVRPRRWAVIDEAPSMKISAPLLKRLSGDVGGQTYRGLYEGFVTERATATVLVICNPGSVPKMRLQDEATAKRLRELPYPPVPNPDPTFKDVVETEAFQQALLARLVSAAAAETPRVPPADVPVVRAATDERITEDIGELGDFARRIVRGQGPLTVADLWAAWCEHNDEDTKAESPGGIGKRRLSSAVREHVNGLPAARQYSSGGKKVRGWKGWKLLDVGETEPEVSAPIPTVQTADAERVAADVQESGEPLIVRLVPSTRSRIVPVEVEGEPALKFVPEGVHPDKVPALSVTGLTNDGSSMAPFVGPTEDTPENRERAIELIAKGHVRYHLDPEAAVAWARRKVDAKGIDKALTDTSVISSAVLASEPPADKAVRLAALQWSIDVSELVGPAHDTPENRERAIELIAEKTADLTRGSRHFPQDMEYYANWARGEVEAKGIAEALADATMTMAHAANVTHHWWELLREEAAAEYAARFARADGSDVTFGDALRALCKQCGEDPKAVEENLAHAAEVIEKVAGLVPDLDEPEIVDPKLPARGDNVVWRGWKLK